jgi:hypothetical protein
MSNSHLRPDGTTFPPVTPDPPNPPGYEEPELLDCDAVATPESGAEPTEPPD